MIFEKLLVLVVILHFVSSSNVYNPYKDSYRVKDPVCKKEKVVNKVPVHELCEYDEIKWNGFSPDFRINNPCNLHGLLGNYRAKVNIPIKFQVWYGKVFFCIERRPGVFSTLNYFDVADIQNKKCPKANCYPNCQVNQFASPVCNVSPTYLTNVLDFEIDKCYVLWALDVGHYDDNSNPSARFVQNPRLCAINVHTDEFIKCYELPSDVNYRDTILGFKTILVNTRGGCANTFVYLFNGLTGKLVVFSLATQSFSSFRSIYLRPVPKFTTFELTLPNYMSHEYVVADGVAAVLGTYGLIFVPRPSLTVYFVSYEFLHNPSKTCLDEIEYDISEIGTLNDHGFTSTLARFNDTVFGVQELNHAIVCYNRKSDINPEAIQLLVKDSQEYVFISDMDLNVEHKRSATLYFLSTNLVNNQFNWFDDEKTKFTFYYIDVKEVLRLYPECKGYYKDVYKQYKHSKQPASYHSNNYKQPSSHHPSTYKHPASYSVLYPKK